MVMKKYQKRTGTCKGPKCDRPVWARGLCGAHLQQKKRGQKRLSRLHEYGRRLDADGNLKTCKFDGCGFPVKASGWCTGHYKQQYDGRPLAPLQKNSRTAGK